MKLFSKGFSPVEIVMVVAVVAIIGVVGFVAWNKFAPKSDSKTATESSITKTSEEVKAVPIKSSEDLDKAVDTLESTSLDDTDVTSAQKQASF